MNVTAWDGEPISTPGIYKNIPMEAYHGQLTVGPSISSSGLRKIFSLSPAHFYAESYLNPNRAEQKDSEALILGRGAHHLLLGEADFSRHFAIRPAELNGSAWNSNRTDCKQWLAHCREQGLTVLLPAQIEAIRGMARGLHEHPLVRAGVLNGLIEHSIVWQDEETGIWLKVRPDAIPTDDLDFSDLKTCADISDDGIERAISDRGYHVQGALVGKACRAVLKREMNSFSDVFSEKAEPYCARVKTLKPCDLELGEKQINAALRVFARCLERQVWPGPGGEQTDAEYVEIKPWARTQIERRLEIMEQELAA
jgi:hypothetical protein